MEWINIIQKSLNYIEDHVSERLDATILAQNACVSEAYFQKIFRIVTGITVADYIRNRRLSLAGEDMQKGRKVIDTAMTYGYESPESFTKAFTRFHGVTPSAARKTPCKLNYFSPLNINISIEGGFIMSRRLIPNVEKLYENRTENYMFPSCMRSAMSALNEDEEFDFSFFAGVCGDLFTQIWLEPKWRYNDSYSNVCKETQIPVRNAFNACGYEYTYVTENEIRKDKTDCIKKITASIDKGFPVLAFGIVGPPVCSIICGYAEEGDVLIGWSQFTGETSDDIIFDHEFSQNYFQVRNGLDTTDTLIFFGKKKDRQSIAASIRTSLYNIAALASLPSTDDIRFGKDAFDAWAASLLDDAYFQNADMLEGALDTYLSCIVQTGTNLNYMEPYLRKAMDVCPDLKEQIEKLLNCFLKEKEAFEEMIEVQGGYFFEKDRQALLHREFRICLSKHVNEIGRRYEQAVQVASSICF